MRTIGTAKQVTKDDENLLKWECQRHASETMFCKVGHIVMPLFTRLRLSQPQRRIPRCHCPSSKANPTCWSVGPLRRELLT